MLAFLFNNTPAPWVGQAVNGVLHPLNVEQLWSDADLNGAGLYRVTPFVAPVGQQIAGPATYTLSGNVVIETFPTEPVPPPPPVTSVSNRQGRLALLGAGLLSQVQAAINADATGALAIWWDYSTAFDRQNPQLLQVANTLGLTSSQIDALFATAATL